MGAPLAKLWSIINSGTNAEKMEDLPKFPRIVDLELTNTCNLKCRMCPTGMNTSTRRKGYISMATVGKVVSECSNYNTPIRLIRWGEPMQHPEAFKIVRFIKSYGLKCHMNTNGTYMDYEVVDDIFDSHLDSIKFSFQGVDSESYAKWRPGSDYNLLCGWVKYLYVQRAQRRKRYPHIQVGTTVSPSTPSVAIEGFRESMGKISDLVTVGETENIINPNETETTPRCPEVFDRLSVNWDGTVTACCRDYDNLLMLGSVKHKTLKEIWNGQQINRIRTCLVNGEHKKLPMCRSCFL